MTVAQLISNKTWGGGEHYALDLADAMQRRGISVAAFVRRPDEVGSRFTAAGIPVSRLPLGGALDIISPLRLASWCNRTDDDEIILHVHNFKDAATAVRAKNLAAPGKKIRVVATRHLVRTASTDRRHTEIYRSIDAIVFVSQLARDTFMSTGPDVDTSRLHVIHNAVRPVEPTERNHDSLPVELLYMGRLAAEKGLHVLIDAIEKLGDIDLRLTVLGDGEGRYVMPLVRRTRSSGTDSRITWQGHVDNTAPWLAKAHIGIVPTVAPEAFGLSVAEMMASGMPVITTSNGAQREIITDGTDGVLVPPSDPDALADEIRRLAAAPELRRKIGANAAATIGRRFAFDSFYNSIMQVYNATL